MTEESLVFKFRVKKILSRIPGLVRIVLLFTVIIIVIALTNYQFMGLELTLTIPSLIAAFIWAISFLVLNESSKHIDSHIISPKGPARSLYYSFISTKSALMFGLIPFCILLILNLTIFNPQVSSLIAAIPNAIPVFLVFSILFGIMTYIFGTGFYYHAHLLGKKVDVEFQAGAIKFSIVVITVIFLYLFGIFPATFPNDFFNLYYLLQDPIAIISAIVLIMIFITVLVTLLKKYHGIISYIIIAAISWFVGEIFAICTIQPILATTSDYLLIINLIFMFVYIGILAAFTVHLGIFGFQKITKSKTYTDFKKEVIKTSGQTAVDAFLLHGMLSLVLGYFFHLWGYSLLNLIPANLIIAFWSQWIDLIMPEKQ